jgi:MFS family permease
MSYLQSVRLINRNVWKLMWVPLIVGFGLSGIYAVLFNLYLLRLGYGVEFIGMLSGTAFLVSATCAIPAGMFGRRWGLRRGVLGGYCVWVVASFLIPLSEFAPVSLRTGWLFAAWSLAWSGAVLFGVNRNPYLVALTSTHERAHAFAISGVAAQVSGVAGSLIAGFMPGIFAQWFALSLESATPYRYALYVPPLLYLLVLPAIWSVQEAPAQRREQAMTSTGVPTPVTTGAPRMLFFAMALVTVLIVMAENAVFTFFNVYMDAGLQVSTVTIGFVISLAQVAAIPATLAAPLLVARLGNFRLLLTGTLSVIFGALLVAFAGHWVLVALGYGAVVVLTRILEPMRTIYHQEIVATEWRSPMAGVATMSEKIGKAAIVAAGGFLIVWIGYQGMFTVAALLTLCGVTFFWAYFRLPSRKPISAPIGD